MQTMLTELGGLVVELSCCRFSVAAAGIMIVAAAASLVPVHRICDGPAELAERLIKSLWRAQGELGPSFDSSDFD